MKYKRISTLSKYFAQCNKQDELQKLKGKFIFRESDFTEQDKREIEEDTQKVISIFKHANNKHNSEILTELETVLPYYFIGFCQQEEYIATCKYNKINIII